MPPLRVLFDFREPPKGLLPAMPSLRGTWRFRTGSPGRHHLRHYEIVGTIGAGGMGEVYLARNTQLQRNVALACLGQKAEAIRHGRTALNKDTLVPYLRSSQLTA